MARILFILLLSSYSQAFNLETRTPIVKMGGAYPDSYFGFSVAQHKTVDGEPVILVGAPKDKNLQPGTERSGALYRCRLSLQTDDCDQVETDGRRHNAGRLYGIYDGNLTELKPPISSEIKEDQWLGVSLQSQGEGGNVLVCAHRYSVRDVDRVSRQPIDSKRAMLGMCYILQPDLTLPRTTSIGAKNILVVREALRGKRLELINDFDNHAKFGVCQVGTSAGWIKKSLSGAQDENYALFGAPGCFTWRGNVLGQRTGTTGSYETAVHEDNYLGYTKHGHLGLSVTSGNYFNDDLIYASGAPHVNGGVSGSGEIYFFKQSTATSKLEMLASRTLRGGGFGAGFGYSLETIDINRDGMDDLIVGAPFTEHEAGGGSVFIYLNHDGHLDSSNYIEIQGATRDSQFGLSLASLGDINKDGFQDLAVGAPYEDAGVVYVLLGSASGLAGLKRNRRTVSAVEVASQIIRGSDLAADSHTPTNPALATFGSSLSGGMDLDNNNYPDLLVGSYEGNSVHLLLSRPIINISTAVEDSQLQAVDPGQSGCLLDPDSQFTCFAFSACFKVESRFPDSMRIRFQIVAEPQKPVSRVWLSLEDQPAQDNRTKLVEHDLIIQEGGREYCTTMLGYLSNSQTDLQTPVKFALSYTLVQEEPRAVYNQGNPVLDIDKFPILNQQQALRTFFARFQKNCGSDDLCQAQLIVQPRLLLHDQEFTKSKDGIYELELGTLDQFILDINIQNLGEAAYEAMLHIQIPHSISYVGLGNVSDVNDIKIVNTTYLSVNLGNPFKGLSDKGVNSANIQLRFTPHSVINETLIRFDFTVNTTSELVVDSSTFLHCVVVRRAELKISGRPPASVYYGGLVKGESALKDVSEIGPLVQHRYLITNYGPSEVDVVTIKIKWPFQVENNKPQGKWLLYLTDHPLLKNGKGDCTVPSGLRPNPLNLTSKSESKNRYKPSNIVKQDSDIFESAIAERILTTQSFSSLPDITRRNRRGAEYKERRKRDVEYVVAPVRVVGAEPEQLVVRLDCERGTAKCLTITCQVYNLPARDSVTVDIRSRLWNSTLVEDYSHVDRVEIFSKASVIIDSVYTQNVTNDYGSVMTVALPERQLEPIQKLDWWIYILSAAVGLLLLVFIILILWKLGFFRRNRPLDDDTDYMVSANCEKVKLNSEMFD